MEPTDFDAALVSALLREAGLVGWREATIAGAARSAGLDLATARARVPAKTVALIRLGRMLDAAALAALPPGPSAASPRDRLFDLVMARFDALQAHRTGVLALMEAMRADPPLAALLWVATLRSMRWLLEAAEQPTGGFGGVLRIHGLGAVWAYGLRAWKGDESADLSATMAAVDRALDRASRVAGANPFCPRQARREEFAPASGPLPPVLDGDDIAAAQDGPGMI